MKKLPKFLIRSPQTVAFFSLPFVLLLLFVDLVSGFGSMGPISASFGDSGVFCAIDASGKQEVICWGNKSYSSSSANPPPIYPDEVPAMAALTGGRGFLCGILANSSQAYCWDSTGLISDLVPASFKPNAYFHIAAGQNHVCAIRGTYYSDGDWGTVDCWDIVPQSKNGLTSRPSTLFYDQHVSTLAFKKIVSGDGFSCGVVRDGGLVCWGPYSKTVEVSSEPGDLFSMTSGIDSICGISRVSGGIKCWGNNDSFGILPDGIRFVSVAAGAKHFCGIREDDHGVECWGKFNTSLVPKSSGFLALASTDFVTCGIREADLVLDCWFANGPPPLDYDPPLQLCSPGLCSPATCGEGKFAFNASILNEPDLTNLCVRKDLKICSPCALNCSAGFFTSSACTENADRVCTACSLCQNSSCWDICGLQSSPEMKQKHQHQLRELLLIIGSSASGFMLILLGWYLLPRVASAKRGGGGGKRIHFASCIGKPEQEIEINGDPNPPSCVVQCPGIAQVFRLSELKDATNGFKEFNELGRGNNGFVYKAVLPDGRQVAVKRANAATIIHTNSRDFELELEVLCRVRHVNIVNLLGCCTEMGERILVYEFMPHGTLHDHLHGGLSPLNWAMRLKIAMQAAKGLEYLHNEVVPPIAHRDLKSSKILLDADWGARITDFALLTPNDGDISQDMKVDVLNFGIVLLEILSGRKAYDADCQPPSLVDSALPLIRQGKAAAIIDRCIGLPRNVEPLLKLADIAELALREDPCKRPSMSDLVLLLEHLVKEGLLL
ncbi:serine/threonine-protein kinase-like protein CCR1 [Coffea eugenioides]|uniref:serine/threonine-protein kinase-like protein CCR1 n=1 Tax=Coffea eugenioides TaxID=49369 RepID=UPI000F608E16|nr:serine/threonine-protein kinase-like protein CCR1 [Coffea eugenioides]